MSTFIALIGLLAIGGITQAQEYAAAASYGRYFSMYVHSYIPEGPLDTIVVTSSL